MRDQRPHADDGPPFRLVIAGMNYWPEVTGIAPYTTAFAQHMAHLGHHVTVLTGVPHYPHWTVSPPFNHIRFRTESREGVTVVRAPIYVPSRQSALRRAGYEVSLLVHLLRVTRLPRPDVVVGVVPSLSGGVLAGVLGRYLGVPYGVIFQDLMGPAVQQSGIEGGNHLVATTTRELEGWVARGAAAVGTATSGFAPYLSGLGVDTERIHELPNWSHVGGPSDTTDARREVRCRHGWGTDDFVVLHAGNMGYKQGLEQVIEAARVSDDPTLRFVLMGDGNQRARLEAMAGDAGSLSLLPLEPDDGFMSTLRAADVLLISERPSVREMSLPSKLTSYLSAGRPIIAAVAPGSITHDAVVRTGAGITVQAGEPGQLLSALSALRNDPARAARLGAAGRTYAERELSQEAALARMQRFVHQIARAPAGNVAP